MAEPTISLTGADIVDRITASGGYAAETIPLLQAQDGYRWFLAGIDPRHMVNPDRFPSFHKWSFLFPLSTISTLVDSTAATIATAVYAGATGLTTITVTGATPFLATMVGHTLTAVTAETTWLIRGVTSSTVVTVTGDASALHAAGDTCTVAADGWVALPDNFGGFLGNPKKMIYPITLPGYGPISLIDLMDLRAKNTANAGTTGYPVYAALRPMPFVSSVGTRYGLEFYPSASAAVELVFRQRLIPATLANDTTYPLGAALHSQTILAAGQAEREEGGNDRPGPWTVKRDRLMAASIDLDRDLAAPDFIGPSVPDGRGLPVSIDGMTLFIR